MDNEFAGRLKKIEETLEETLPPVPDQFWKRQTFGNLPECIVARHIDPLTAPCRRLIGLGGKRWRPLLLVLCAEMAATEMQQKNEISEGNRESEACENAYLLTPLVEFCHTASLIHDDIEDNADVRRGKAAAHLVFGIDTAINSASWLYFEAMTCINELDVPAAAKGRFYRLYEKELCRLHLGQAMDISWHRDPDLIPSVTEYDAMVQCKTGTLSSLAAQIGILAGGGTEAQAEKAGRIAADIGRGFQILDDVKNLTTGNPGKQRGDDVVEGKKSLPVLLYLQEHPEDKQSLIQLMIRAGKEGVGSPAVENFISKLFNSGCILEAQSQGLRLIRDKSSELGSLYHTKDAVRAGSAIVRMFDDMVVELKKNK